VKATEAKWGRTKDVLLDKEGLSFFLGARLMSTIPLDTAI